MLVNPSIETKGEVMAVREVLLYPDKMLLKRAEEVKHFGPQILQLVKDLFETMASHEGVGLAAPQVGVLKRILVLQEPEKEEGMCLINPEIKVFDGSETGEEGCLSLPQIYAPISRRVGIEVSALDEHGRRRRFEAAGLLARIIQHEADHLEGIVFLDRADVLTRDAKLREWNQARAQPAVPTGAR
jgi:peptide deformylase